MLTKIATCCYCGARAALVLDAGRHELSCGSCGAPLHEMKSLPLKPQTEAPRPQLASFAPAAAQRKGKKIKKQSKDIDKKSYLSGFESGKLSRKLDGKKLFGKIRDSIEDIFD